jgi:hypothetical protein
MGMNPNIAASRIAISTVKKSRAFALRLNQPRAMSGNATRPT